MNDRRTHVIGLVGGIASGKSYVGRLLEELGVPRVDADVIGHEVLNRADIREALVERFGEQILVDGAVDRRTLGALVFGSSPQAAENLQVLEGIVHPAIHATVLQEVSQLTSASEPPIAIVIDAPLLLEAGWESMCDWILLIDVPDAVRLKRAQLRGWDEDQFRTREAAQFSLEQKRRAATHRIDGQASAEEIKRRLKHLLEQMKKNTR